MSVTLSKLVPKGLFRRPNGRSPIVKKGRLIAVVSKHVLFFVYRKIFVGGIAVSTTKAKLTSYFSRFGHITDCIIMVDRDHSKSPQFNESDIDPLSRTKRLRLCNI